MPITALSVDQDELEYAEFDAGSWDDFGMRFVVDREPILVTREFQVHRRSVLIYVMCLSLGYMEREVHIQE